ncbi:SNF1-like protein kinase ssp2 [Smittium culicis]|uniref:non-specific serine/threonine protein kinase n=1 Tax=Smittium culicis TaxID=133412 RepID=A0A1R1X0P6_9FUNG|nr:SNF1-like protein kinase ssp2 [Smittium culicis]
MSSQARIGDYSIIKTVGSGSFGKVKKAIHAYSNQIVAMKIISRSKLSHSDMIGRVNREIQYLKKLRHPHIIKLYEVISNKVDIIMVMEFAGGELFNYLVEKGRMPELEAKRFFQQIISAVEYCHKRGIVHSPNYAAPEVINGKLYAGPDVDVWSCGIILYVMLCGKLPFDDENIPSLFKKISSGVFSIPSHVSSGAKNLIQQMLIVDPLKRITISKIRDDPWFNSDLPEYLRPLPEGTDPMQLDIINNEIVDIVSEKLGIKRSEIIALLKVSGYNYVKVSYQLIMDNKYMLEVSKLTESDGIKNFGLSTSPPAWNAMSVSAFSPSSLKNSPMLSSMHRNENFNNNIHSSPINKNNDDDIFEPSSVSVLGSSIPKPKGLTTSGSKLADSNRFPIIPGKIPVVKQSNITRAVLENNAIRSSAQKNGEPTHSNSPKTSAPIRIPSNYFRASLPPVSSVRSNSSFNSNRSSNENNSSLANNSNGDVNMTSSTSSLHAIPNANDRSPNPTSTTTTNPYPKATGYSRFGNISNPIDVKRNNSNSPAEQSSVPGSNSSSFNPSYFAPNKPLERKQTKTRSRWHFGIRSRSQPSEVMSEIYKTLVTLNMEWKQINPYKIRIRYHSPVMSEDIDQSQNATGIHFSDNYRNVHSSSNYPRQNSPFSKIGGFNKSIVEKKIIETKVDLQLYKLDSRNYLVDFKVVIPSSKSQSQSGTDKKVNASLPIVPEPIDVASVSKSLSHSLSKGDIETFNFNSSLSPLTQTNFGSLRVSDQMNSINNQFGHNEPQNVVFENGMEMELDNSNNHSFGEHPSSQSIPNSDNVFGQSIDLGNNFSYNTSDENKPLPEPVTLPEFDRIPSNAIVQSLPRVENSDFPYSGSLISSGIPISGNNEYNKPIKSNPMAIPGASQGLSFEANSYFTSQMANSMFNNSSFSNRNFMDSKTPDQRRGSINVNKSATNTSGQVFNIFPFFEVCTKLITELTLPSQKS